MSEINKFKEKFKSMLVEGEIKNEVGHDEYDRSYFSDVDKMKKEVKKHPHITPIEDNDKENKKKAKTKKKVKEEGKEKKPWERGYKGPLTTGGDSWGDVVGDMSGDSGE
jgi:hypothetical protein